MKIFTRNEWLTLAVIPIELLLGNSLGALLEKQATALSIAATVLFIIGFLSAVLLNRRLLAEQWHTFRSKFWLKLLLALLLVFAAQFLLDLVRQFLGLNAAQASSLSFLSVYLSLFWSLLPSLLAPFTEELVFRHLLFMKFRTTAKPVLFWILWICQSILFGLVHWSNFDGQILKMVPYMIVGGFFGLIYYFSKNIWQNILTHFIFNGIGLFTLTFSLIMSLFSK
ncbi:CPBP family intramembrane glutamic endopeptidase [Lactovum odontotermitis]